MNKWFISGTRFSYTNIIRYTGRPFQSVNEMNERLIENWNALVEPQDTVFFLGDFGLGTTDFLTSLCCIACRREAGIKTNGAVCHSCSWSKQPGLDNEILFLDL